MIRDNSADAIRLRENLAQNVVAYRDLRGWSQSELAKRSKVRRGHISQIENMHTYASCLTLLRLASALGVSTDMLLGRVLP